MFESFAIVSSAGAPLLIPDCELTHLDPAEAFYYKQWFYTFMMPMIVIVCIVVWSLIKCCCKKMKHTRDYMILSIVVLTFMCYPTLVKLTLSVSFGSYCDSYCGLIKVLDVNTFHYLL